MKKTSSIILTLVASVSIVLGTATASSAQSDDPVYPQYLVESEKNSDLRNDTIRADSVRRDTVFVEQPVVFNYYYRSPFWNGLYRFWFPTRYYRVINQPGFVPRHLRPTRGEGGMTARGGNRSRGAGKRGGFGHFGSTSNSN